MANIPNIERNAMKATFGLVNVAQPNKNIGKRMATCKNCGIVIPLMEYNMWTHW